MACFRLLHDDDDDDENVRIFPTIYATFHYKPETKLPNKNTRFKGVHNYRNWPSTFRLHPLGMGGLGMGTVYDVHLGLIGKRVVDFLLVMIDLFSLDITAEALRAKVDWKSAIQRGQFDPKFPVEGDVAHQ